MEHRLEETEAAWYEAKKAFEEYRDGYIPFEQNPEVEEETIERLMREMDEAEDSYLFAKKEYHDYMIHEYRGCYGDWHDGEQYPHKGATIEELYQQVEEILNNLNS